MVKMLAAGVKIARKLGILYPLKALPVAAGGSLDESKKEGKGHSEQFLIVYPGGSGKAKLPKLKMWSWR